MIENPTIWVSVLTFVGVLISIWYAGKRLKKELAHSAAEAQLNRADSRELADAERENARAEAHKDRITSARRTAYTEANDELQKSIGFLSTLQNKTASDSDIGGSLSGFYSATARIELIAEMGTVLLVKELTRKLTVLFMDSAAELVPLYAKKSDLLLAQERYKLIDAQHKELSPIYQAGMMLNPQQQHFRDEKERLENDLQRLRETIESVTAQIEEMKKTYALGLAGKLIGLHDLISTLTIRARQEMGVETDVEQYETAARLSVQESSGALARLVSAVEATKR